MIYTHPKKNTEESVIFITPSKLILIPCNERKRKTPIMLKNNGDLEGTSKTDYKI